MRNKTILFLILTLITGLIGFTGLNFYGIIGIRFMFLLFAVLMLTSLLAKVFFKSEKKMKPIKVRK